MKKKFILPIIAFILLISNSAFANVSYLGPAGTYTEEATILYFGKDETIIPAKTVPDAVALVTNGSCEYAVIPQENTIGGSVYNYLDVLINNEQLVVIGEINLPIRQTLLALPNAKLSDIKTVLSHPQGIAQSKDWLNKNLPNAKLVEVSSTADGARQVAEKKDPSIAAIAASRTANVYNLEILANDLQYTQTNVTRFYVVTTPKHQTIKEDKNSHSAIIAKGSSEYLPDLLADLDKYGFKLVSIHDRSAKTILGEYNYVIEVAGGKYDKLQNLQKKYADKMSIRLLGSFDVK